MNIRKIIAIILMVVSVILAILSIIMLPETVISQISLSGSEPSTMPKWAMILLATALGAGFSLAAFLEKGEKKTVAKYIFVSVVGIFIFVFGLIVNC